MPPPVSLAAFQTKFLKNFREHTSTTEGAQPSAVACLKNSTHAYPLPANPESIPGFSTCPIIMAALRSRCGHYIIFALWFLSFYLSIFSSSLNLSGRRLDVYHTSTHDVALVRI